MFSIQEYTAFDEPRKSYPAVLNIYYEAPYTNCKTKTTRCVALCWNMMVFFVSKFSQCETIVLCLMSLRSTHSCHHHPDTPINSLPSIPIFLRNQIPTTEPTPTRNTKFATLTSPMAVRLQDLLQATQLLHPNKVKDQTCPVCYEDYLQDPSREFPRKLPCGHIIGTECLLLWVSSKTGATSIDCPWCTKTIVHSVNALSFWALASTYVSTGIERISEWILGAAGAVDRYFDRHSIFLLMFDVVLAFLGIHYESFLVQHAFAWLWAKTLRVFFRHRPCREAAALVLGLHVAVILGGNFFPVSDWYLGNTVRYFFVQNLIFVFRHNTRTLMEVGCIGVLLGLGLYLTEMDKSMVGRAIVGECIWQVFACLEAYLLLLPHWRFVFD